MWILGAINDAAMLAAQSALDAFGARKNGSNGKRMTTKTIRASRSQRRASLEAALHPRILEAVSAAHPIFQSQQNLPALAYCFEAFTPPPAIFTRSRTPGAAWISCVPCCAVSCQ
jgi:hypothetical protein